ncbi:hypothetical protein TcWFU_001578 [Taenia crassiceps]|uniref:Uncharacterized protein n=1 Tax=Taenia crassiceps TaxID=6207 RepID=A0ABR4Q3E8_9CEST
MHFLVSFVDQFAVAFPPTSHNLIKCARLLRPELHVFHVKVPSLYEWRVETMSNNDKQQYSYLFGVSQIADEWSNAFTHGSTCWQTSKQNIRTNSPPGNLTAAATFVCVIFGFAEMERQERNKDALKDEELPANPIAGGTAAGMNFGLAKIGSAFAVRAMEMFGLSTKQTYRARRSGTTTGTLAWTVLLLLCSGWPLFPLHIQAPPISSVSSACHLIDYWAVINFPPLLLPLPLSGAFYHRHFGNDRREGEKMEILMQIPSCS